jgi:hypothetical protein
VLAPGVDVTAPEESPESDEDESSSHPPESSLDDESYGSLDVVDVDVDVLVVDVVAFTTPASAGSSPS